MSIGKHDSAMRLHTLVAESLETDSSEGLGQIIVREMTHGARRPHERHGHKAQCGEAVHPQLL